MALVKKGSTVIMRVLTAIMASFLTWFGVQPEQVDPPKNPTGTNMNDQSRGFRIPLPINYAHATMHESTIAGLTTVLRFKATIMNKTHAQINGFLDQLFHEAKQANDARDPKALLTSTKRLMMMNEALRDRIIMTESKRK
ncbi:MAG: hypothetical protein OEZ57_03145 [Nitrospirota bacterium]|nr:hypothetical protein [Nitrospirota bacterium]MDH5585444.1 hypothetical protein [Nitrospirota bacterium]MDH5773896.1 hypothetical protein [Nitrospirota bacterium]